MSTIPTGRFTWYQLNATEPDAAFEFYSALIGWSKELWTGGDGPPYTMVVRDDGVPVGGIMALPEEPRKSGTAQHWLAYISTPDVDRTVMQARDHRAQIFVPPTDLPGIGRFAVLADPQGAPFAVFAPLEPPEDTAFAPQLGDVSWHELMTTDYPNALAFYTDLFDWEKREAMDMGEAGSYQLFGRGGSELGGMFNKTAEMPAPPNWLLYFRVDDVDKQVKRLDGLGGQLLNGPMDVPGGDRIAQCMDPQGGAFAIHSSG